MKKLLAFALLLPLTGCAICKSSDSVEACRTKQREHGHAAFTAAYRAAAPSEAVMPAESSPGAPRLRSLAVLVQ
jgi:hypothetical protein